MQAYRFYICQITTIDPRHPRTCPGCASMPRLLTARFPDEQIHRLPLRFPLSHSRVLLYPTALTQRISAGIVAQHRDTRHPLSAHNATCIHSCTLQMGCNSDTQRWRSIYSEPLFVPLLYLVHFDLVRNQKDSSSVDNTFFFLQFKPWLRCLLHGYRWPYGRRHRRGFVEMHFVCRLSQSKCLQVFSSVTVTQTRIR